MRTRDARAIAATVLALGATALVGCGRKGTARQTGDSAAGLPPAMQSSPTVPQAPESTTGLTQRTNRPGVSGDSTGRSHADSSPPTRRPPE